MSKQCQPLNRTTLPSQCIIICCEHVQDDKVAMRFVTAACNLRSLVFGIAPQRYHDAKGIAGNIIPAIATTNAIIAGLQVLEALKIMQVRAAASCTACYLW